MGPGDEAVVIRQELDLHEQQQEDRRDHQRRPRRSPAATSRTSSHAMSAGPARNWTKMLLGNCRRRLARVRRSRRRSDLQASWNRFALSVSMTRCTSV